MSHYTFPKKQAVTMIADRLDRVPDGDTLVVSFGGVPVVFGQKIPVRIRGINALEIRDKDALKREAALKARDFLCALLHGKRIELQNVVRGKYFRLLADVVVDGTSVADVLVDNGHAVKC